MKKVLFSALVTVALLLGLSGTAVAAPPDDTPGNGPPEFDKIVFIHYPKGEAPGKPGGTSGKGSIEGEYKLTRYHWADTSIPVTYVVNLGGLPDTFLVGIQAAFQTWEDDPLSYMDFTYGGTTGIGISSLANQMDGYNVVGWANISAQYPNAIAVTIFWYNVATKHLAEVDVAMNSDPYFAWWQNDAGNEVWDSDKISDAYDVDVQNIMTHEAGHWLVLGDLYASYNTDKTMYGYSGEFELMKRSLTSGDSAGIQKIYPGSTIP